MNRLLETLASEAFAVEVGFLLPPPALRRRLQRSSVVRQVAQAVRLGMITEADVRTFAEQMVRHFKPGYLLPGELALAALAVALEFCPQDFAEEYLCHLARLRLSELGTALRVARECLTFRLTRPKNEIRQFPFTTSPRRLPSGSRVFVRRPNSNRWSAGGQSRYTLAGA